MIENVFIEGNCHSDVRGTICFFNELDMTEVRRFYLITHPNTETQRGWRAHRIEQRWFHVLKGEFSIKIVKVDNWDSPSQKLPISEHLLTEEKKQVLHVAPGYATLLQAIIPNSSLLVFADQTIENAPKDNYTFAVDFFKL